MTSADTGHPGGLRERKKLATRQALGSAAMELALDRGLENVVIEDIAAAAGVSARTFSNYFASKYEAIAALALDRSWQIGEELRRRPAGEDLWAAICQAVLAVYAPASEPPDLRRIAAIQLVTSSPALRGEYLKALSIMQYEMAQAITERAGADPVADTFFTRALAGAVTAVLQAATERWLFADPPVPLVPVIETALGELAGGMRAVLPAGPAPAAAENSEPAMTAPG
ncbi:MAG TPA: TetR family transcriptional regulator [Streptosporangiaceae bacterium]|jgi:AcrR family transcriptional regulator